MTFSVSLVTWSFGDFQIVASEGRPFLGCVWEMWGGNMYNEELRVLLQGVGDEEKCSPEAYGCYAQFCLYS